MYKKNPKNLKNPKKPTGLVFFNPGFFQPCLVVVEGEEGALLVGRERSLEGTSGCGPHWNTESRFWTVPEIKLLKNGRENCFIRYVVKRLVRMFHRYWYSIHYPNTTVSSKITCMPKITTGKAWDLCILSKGTKQTQTNQGLS
jgi:hypothetical protein